MKLDFNDIGISGDGINKHTLIKYSLLSFMLIMATLCSAQTIWLGNTSSDWFDQTNWSNGLPMPGNNAAIPTSPPGDFLPTINQAITVDFGIENANILTFFGDVTNNNTIINYEDGSIINYGELNNNLVIDNDGDFFSGGDIYNFGDFDNSGTLHFDFGDAFYNEPNGRLYNYGPINLVDTYFSNMGVLYMNGGVLSCTGKIENFGLIQNNGTIENLECGIFDNQGDINNQLIIINDNLFYSEGSYIGNPVDHRLSIQNNSGITQANHQCTDQDGWTHFSESLGSKILLSIYTDTVDIGSVIDQTLSIDIKNDIRLGSGNVSNLNDALYRDCDDWYTSNRSWVIRSTVNQGNTPFKIRFYFNDFDFQDIKNTFPISQSDQELVFYKLLGTENAYETDISEMDVSFFEKDLINPGQSTWQKKPVGFANFAEIEVNGLNGAYSSGVKSWLGGTIPFHLTFNTIPNSSDQTVNLEWSTGIESGNLEYYLQRSEDGVTFSDFASVPANAPTTAISTYSAIDNTPFLQDATYYRIKLVRNDGSTRYSTIKEVSFSSGEISLFPNPSLDELHLKLSELNEGEITINIFDINGHLLYKDLFTVSNNITTDNILEKVDLAAGMYSLQVIGVNKSKTLRFIKVVN